MLDLKVWVKCLLGEEYPPARVGNTTIHQLLPSRSCDENVGQVGNLSYVNAVHPPTYEENNLAKAPSLRKGKRCIGSPPGV